MRRIRGLLGDAIGKRSSEFSPLGLLGLGKLPKSGLQLHEPVHRIGLLDSSLAHYDLERPFVKKYRVGISVIPPMAGPFCAASTLAGRPTVL
jgi:hypothetical protein